MKTDVIMSEYDDDILSIANELSNGDTFLSEELRSEMYVRLLRMIENPIVFSEDSDRHINLLVLKRRAVEYLAKKQGTPDVSIFIKEE